MLVAAVVTGEVVVEEGVQIEAPVLVNEVAQSCTANQTGTETAVFAGEGTDFVEVVEIDVIVCHPVGFAFNMVVKPAAHVATRQQVSAHFLSAEREVGHDGEHQVVVVVLGIEFVQIVEVAVHTVRALHHAEVGGDSNPILEAVARL